MNFQNDCYGFAVGMRYSPNFFIEDSLGKIVDNILYKKESTFNPSIFPEVLSNNGEKILIDKSTNNQLKISNTNVVLDINSIKSANQVTQLIKRFKPEIIDYLLDDIKLKNIARIGVLRRYAFDNRDMINRFIESTLSTEFKGADDIQLRFSSILASDKALLKKGVNDFNSVIYTIVKNREQNKLIVTVDYQMNFEPYVDKNYQIEYDKFINANEKYIDNDFKNWITKYFGINENG